MYNNYKGSFITMDMDLTVEFMTMLSHACILI